MRFAALPLSLLVISATAVADPHWGPAELDLLARPRTLMRPGDAALVQSRLDREPYLQLLRSVQAQADRNDPLDDSSVSMEQRRFNTAKCAALLYTIDRFWDGSAAVPFTTPEERQAMGRKAEAILLVLNIETRLTNINTSQLDIHVAQELHGYSVAYDLLAASDFPFGAGNREAIERRLWILAADLHDAYVRRFSGVAEGGNENHASKTAAGLGLAAIALNGVTEPADWPAELPFSGPAEWIALALERTDRVLAFGLTDLDGGYTEGAVYHGYSGINHWPFMRALHRYTDGQELEADGVRFPDFWTDPWVVAQADWLLRIRVPDGTFPPHDDCTPDGTYMWGTLTELPHGAHYRWAWEQCTRQYESGGSVEQATDSLVVFDDAVVPEPPPWEPSQFLEHAGIAIFRSSWDADATFMAIQAEHGAAAGYCHRRWGQTMEGCGGHDHNDPGSFMLWRNGGWLALDAGYLGWDNHAKVNNDHNHNIVLVDGKGPKKSYLKVPDFYVDENGELQTVPGKEGGYMPGGDGVARLVRSFDHGSFGYAEVETSYFKQVPETTIRRRFVWYKPWDAFFITDRVEVTETDGQGARTRADLSVHLHGNGGGDTGGSFQLLDANGAEWITPEGNGLRAYVASTYTEPVIAESTDLHDAGHWVEKIHATATATINGSSVDFITALVTSRPGDTWPVAETSSTDEIGGIEGQRGASVRLERAGGEVLVANVGVDPFLSPRSAERAALFVAPGAATLPMLLDLHALVIPDLVWLENALTREEPFTLALESLDDPISGYAIGGPATLHLRTTVEPGSVTGVCAASRDGQDLILELAAVPHAFSVTATAGNSTPVAATHTRLDGNVDTTLDLDATPSCDANGEALTYQWEVLRAPWSSTAQPAKPSAAQTAFTPDRYGDYRLQLTVSDGKASDSVEVILHAEPALPEPEIEETAEAEFDADIAPDADADGAQEAEPATDEKDAHGCGCAI